MDVPKNWVDKEDGLTTPISAVALEAMERRVGGYTGTSLARPGVDRYESFRVKQNGAGTTLTVLVGLPASLQRISLLNTQGGGNPNTGPYRHEYSAAGQLQLTLQPADTVNPRVDRVISLASTSVDDPTPQFQVLTGTPAAGASADTLTGAQAIPAGAELLVDINVAANATGITTTNIRDRRRYATRSVPQVVAAGSTGREEVCFVPPANLIEALQTLTPTTHDNQQVACLVDLPTRIVGATRIRWRYQQGATAATSNYNIAICDPSGRPIVSPGAVAFTGAANAVVEAALTIAATTFEAGSYILLIGFAPITAASGVTYFGTTIDARVPTRSHQFRAATGGTTLPAAINAAAGALTDLASVAVATSGPGVPMMSLSVG